MRKSLAVLFIVILCVGFVNAQSKTSFLIDQVVIAPFGQFSNAYEKGIGGGAGFQYKIAPNFSLTFGGGYYKCVDKTNVDFSISSIPLYVGARYYPVSTTETGPYVNVEIGIQSMAWDQKDSTLFNTIYLFSKNTLYQSYFSYGFGAGVIGKITEKIGVDIFYKYNSILIEGSNPRNYLNIGLGLIFAW
jgi:opacity protein-like surface antigen